MAQSSSVSEKLRNRCTRLPDIIDEINYNASMRSALWRDHERAQSVALDYRMISSLISRCGAISEEENTIDAEGGATLSLRVSELLELDCAAAIFGKRQRRALLSFDISAKEKTESDEVQKKLCAVLYDFLGGEAVLIDTRVKDDTLSLTYGRAAKISVSFDARSVNAFGEDEYCGDSYGICSDEESCRTLAFISDGMGCGREASEVSRTVASFLKNILPLSYDCDHTVKMLNAFLRRRGGDSIRECSATVDLANIDLMASRASFYKSGAAPTYVLRGDSVFKIRARSIPVGIISEVDIQKTDLELYPSDIIVMISDGVTQGKEECPRLFELLKSTRSTDPRRISELVVKYALDSGGKDDISVLVLRVDSV
jgi:stage II sporulation protein E